MSERFKGSVSVPGEMTAVCRHFISQARPAALQPKFDQVSPAPPIISVSTVLWMMEAEQIPKDKSDIFGGSLSLFLTVFPCPMLHHFEAAACSTPYMLDMLL